MQVEVTVNGWKVGRGEHRATYNRGDIVDADLLAATFNDGHARLDGYRRLGFFRIVEEKGPSMQTSKPDLLRLAKERGVEVPDKATKTTILELLGA